MRASFGLNNNTIGNNCDLLKAVEKDVEQTINEFTLFSSFFFVVPPRFRSMYHLKLDITECDMPLFEFFFCVSVQVQCFFPVYRENNCRLYAGSIKRFNFEYVFFPVFVLFECLQRIHCFIFFCLGLACANKIVG